MRKERNWFGVDSSNKESLFEHGFLMRYNPKRKDYEVIYMNGIDEKENYIFSFGSFDMGFWIEEIEENINEANSFPNVVSIAKMCGMDTKEWFDTVKDSPQNLLSDLLSYYGSYEIFTDAYVSYYSVPQIKKRLNRALLN